MSSILYLNDMKRIEKQDNYYYEIIQPLQHFNYCPQTGINIYSFSLKPCEFQPSGSCNMSAIDNIKLFLNLNNTISKSNPGHLKVYGVCYNILKIESEIDSERNDLHLFLSGEIQNFPVKVNSAFLMDINGPQNLNIIGNRITGFSLHKGKVTCLKIVIDYKDYCSLEVQLYAAKE